MLTDSLIIEYTAAIQNKVATEIAIDVQAQRAFD